MWFSQIYQMHFAPLHLVDCRKHFKLPNKRASEGIFSGLLVHELIRQIWFSIIASNYLI